MGIVDTLGLREMGAAGEEAEAEGPPPPPLLEAPRTSFSSSWTREESASNSALETYFSLATATFCQCSAAHRQ